MMDQPLLGMSSACVMPVEKQMRTEICIKAFGTSETTSKPWNVPRFSPDILSFFQPLE